MLVECLECGEFFKVITLSHLKSRHNMTTYQYADKYPNAPMMSGDFIRDPVGHSKAISESWWSKSEEERNRICEILSEAHTGVYPDEDTRKKRMYA